jgi:hypothetical protein
MPKLFLFMTVVDNFNANATINDARPKIFKHSPEEIAEQFMSQPSKFVAFLFANYPGYFTASEHCAMAADTLSAVDMLLTDYRVGTPHLESERELLKLTSLYSRTKSCPKSVFTWPYVG